ncbi:MAG: hypothetical protein ACT4P6_24065, partial [Gemmatimonadaceae bacterium]
MPGGTLRANYRCCLAFFFVACPMLAEPALALEIPYWARKYSVTCSKCHVSVPRLNRFGAEFIARGYRLPSDSGSATRTVP